MWKFPLNLCLVPSWSNHQLCAQLWIISQLFHSQTALNKEKWKYCRFFLFLLFSFQFHKYIYLSINSFWVIWTCFTSSFCSLGGLSTSGIKSLPLPHPSHGNLYLRRTFCLQCVTSVKPEKLLVVLYLFPYMLYPCVSCAHTGISTWKWGKSWFCTGVTLTATPSSKSKAPTD